MSAPDAHTFMILAEHLGFPPISLVDDIINCVNEIMYKCSTALEKYLDSKEEKNRQQSAKERQHQSIVIEKNKVLQQENHNSHLNEIEVGTAKLETLFESSVDKNFDLFELYTLRNILNIPTELADGGWVKLEHYKHVKSVSNVSEKLSDVNKKIAILEKEIKFQLYLKRKLMVTLKKSKKLYRMLTIYRQSLSLVVNNNRDYVKVLTEKRYNDDATKNMEMLHGGPVLSKESQNALRSLSPLLESLFFLKNEAKELYAAVNLLEEQFGDVKNKNLTPNERDRYVDTKAYRLLQLYDIKKTIQGGEWKSNSLEDEQARHEEKTVSIKLSKVKRSTRSVKEIRRVNERLVIEDER